MSIFDDMDNLAQVQAHLAHWRDQIADGRRKDDFLFGVQAKGIIATLEHKEAELQAAQSAPAPKADQPTGFWWASVDGREPEVVRVAAISFVDKVAFATGNECDIELDRVRLIERVLPAGRAAAAVEKLQGAFDTRCGDDMWGIVGEAVAILQGGENLA